jgi:hypothetical protein
LSAERLLLPLLISRKVPRIELNKQIQKIKDIRSPGDMIMQALIALKNSIIMP